jgi:hypothetical protein
MDYYFIKLLDIHQHLSLGFIPTKVLNFKEINVKVHRLYVHFYI